MIYLTISCENSELPALKEALRGWFFPGEGATIQNSLTSQNTPSRHKSTDQETDDLIWKLYQEGKKPAEIWKLIGRKVSKPTVYKRINDRKKEEAWAQRKIQDGYKVAPIVPQEPVKCPQTEPAQPEPAIQADPEKAQDKGPVQEYRPTPSRAVVGAEILKLHQGGLDPEAIAAEINEKLGLCYSAGMVEKRLREVGVVV